MVLYSQYNKEIYNIWQTGGVFMNISKFTQKSIEAVNSLEKLAYEYTEIYSEISSGSERA